MMPTIKTPRLGRISLIQIIAMLLLSGVSLVVLGWVSAYSVLLGGLISIIPNAYFAAKVFSQTGARAMESIVRNAYLGEFIKLALMGAGFALVFVAVKPLHAPAVFAGFVVVHIVWLVCLIRLQPKL
jgi:ATP synthase protein I